MILFEQMKKSVNIDTLYNYAKSNNVTLFPTEDYDFWAAYETAYQKFDRCFYQKYRAFKVLQDYPADAGVENMLQDFKQIIDAHFFLNAKRYSELFRVQVLATDAYDVVNNYDLNETIIRTNTGTVEDARGARTDSATRGAGSIETSYGAKNAQTVYGAENEQLSYGAKSSSNNTSLGAQTSQSTQSRSAFNAEQLVDVQGGNISNGARSDSATLTEHAHMDTRTRAGRTDSVTEQARTDTTMEAERTDGATIGAQTNTRTDDLEENTTIRRYGNIGVQTPADVIGGHIDLWEAFRFYQLIFDEIAAEYLVLDVDFDFATCPASSVGNPSNVALLSAIREVAAKIDAKAVTDAANVGVIREDVADTHAAVTEVQETLDDFIGG